MGNTAEDISVYRKIFIALLVLTGLTVLASQIDVGPFNIVIALGIAIIKASLVVLFFMHAKNSPVLMRLFITGGFLWLLILFGFTYCDYLTRDWIEVHDQKTSWITKDAHTYKAPSSNEPVSH